MIEACNLNRQLPLSSYGTSNRLTRKYRIGPRRLSFFTASEKVHVDCKFKLVVILFFYSTDKQFALGDWFGDMIYVVDTNVRYLHLKQERMYTTSKFSYVEVQHAIFIFNNFRANFLVCGRAGTRLIHEAVILSPVLVDPFDPKRNW